MVYNFLWVGCVREVYFPREGAAVRERSTSSKAVEVATDRDICTMVDDLMDSCLCGGR